MSAPAGNQFWKTRSTHGRSPIFATSDDLWEACAEYFEWVEANPLWEAKPFAFQGIVTVENIPKMRAMTIAGLCIFLDIDFTTWSLYGGREDYIHVVRRVEQIIRTQKFEGASADLLNANIIARDLGLADKSEVTGKDGGAIKTEDVSARDLAKAIASLLSKGMNANA